MLQPGLLYYYFSTVADVSANEYNINASGIFFDKNASFATWYKTLAFNRTLPLFGPRAYRFDDYNEPVGLCSCRIISRLCSMLCAAVDLKIVDARPFKNMAELNC